MRASKKYILIGVGTAVGAMLRWLCEQIISTLATDNLAVLLVNILGCFIISIFTTLFIRKYISNTIKILIVTGFCGGLTTFSSFVLGMEKLLETQYYINTVAYILLNMMLSLLAIFLGTKTATKCLEIKENNI